MATDTQASGAAGSKHGISSGGGLPDLKPAPMASTSGTASPAGASMTGPGSQPARYTPQFSATTEMILKRIRGEPSNMSSAIKSASAAGVIKQSTYEDAKRRLVMSMNTSLTLPMPTASPPGSSMLSLKPARNPTSPSATVTKTTMANPGGPAMDRLTIPGVAKRGRPSKPDKKGKARAAPVTTARGTKRKRGGGMDDEDASSALSEPPEDSEDAEPKYPVTLTMTKSGRQVQKPAQFKPNATPAGGAVGKRKSYGKRTPEQMLCKVCTRGLSPTGNQVVFCDGCNNCWHQLCHDPYIDDAFVSDESRSWFCRGCVAKRERYLARKRGLEGFKGASWAGKTAEQRRAYLSSLPHSQLVNTLLYSLELHPDLPIFPTNDASKRGVRAGTGTPARDGATHPASPSVPGPLHFTVQAISTPEATQANGKRRSGSKGTPTTNGKVEPNQAVRESSSESVPPAWPKVGTGVLADLKMNEDDFKDGHDYEAFSVAMYDERGKKVLENGMKVEDGIGKGNAASL